MLDFKKSLEFSTNPIFSAKIGVSAGIFSRFSAKWTTDKTVGAPCVLQSVSCTPSCHDSNFLLSFPSSVVIDEPLPFFVQLLVWREAVETYATSFVENTSAIRYVAILYHFRLLECEDICRRAVHKAIYENENGYENEKESWHVCTDVLQPLNTNHSVHWYLYDNDFK